MYIWAARTPGPGGLVEAELEIDPDFQGRNIFEIIFKLWDKTNIVV